jgi:hypothetical protein
MKIFEGMEEYGHQMHLAIKAMLKDVLVMDISDDEARTLTDKLGLSDVLELDTALDDQNEEAIRDIISKHMSLEEYSLPGRSGLKSAATTRPTTQKTGGTTKTTSMTKPVAGGNKTATGGADEIGQDDNTDAETEIADREAELADLKKKAGIR